MTGLALVVIAIGIIVMIINYNNSWGGIATFLVK